MIIRAVCKGRATSVDAKSGQTGHRKLSTAEPVRIDAQGLKDDTIIDRAHHGGPDQAVYVYTDPDRTAWAAYLDRDIPDGWFGENLCLNATTSADWRIGDLLTIGQTTLQVTSPRIPCATFTAVSGLSDGVARFIALARPGFYARVLVAGTVRAGQGVLVTRWNGPSVTIGDAFAATYGPKSPDYIARLLAAPAHHKMLNAARRLQGQTSDPISYP